MKKIGWDRASGFARIELRLSYIHIHLASSGQPRAIGLIPRHRRALRGGTRCHHAPESDPENSLLLKFSRVYPTKQQKSCSAAPHQWCDAIERADAFSAMIASPQPVVRLFRGQSFAWLLHRAAALSRCAASSLLSASIRRANCTRSRPSPTFTVWSIAASSEGLCMRTDSCAIEMLVGRRSLASDCICSCCLEVASHDDSKPLATSDGSTATRAGARCTQKVPHARGHAVARRAVRHSCGP